jgi:hypothetical protein
LNTTLDVKSSASTIFAPSELAKIGRLEKTEVVEEKEDDKKKKAKPTKSPGKGEKGKGKEKKVKWGAVDPMKMEEIFPALSVEEEVPSLMRLRQMQQVEAIRESFAKQGLSVPTSIIEQGILTPEDRPYTECITDLPSPEFGLVRDFTKKREKKGKGKKKAK